jgi:hypothetical protein
MTLASERERDLLDLASRGEEKAGLWLDEEVESRTDELGALWSSAFQEMRDFCLNNGVLPRDVSFWCGWWRVVKAPPRADGGARTVTRSAGGRPVDVLATRIDVTVDAHLASELTLTENSFPAKSIWPEFRVLVSPPLAWLAGIDISFRRAVSVLTVSGGTVEIGDVWTRDVVENLANGVQEFIATTKPSSHMRGPRTQRGVTSSAPTGHVATAERAICIGDGLSFAAAELLSGRPAPERLPSGAVLVRGHRARQPCGPGGLQRKLIWRRPHYSPRQWQPVRAQSYTLKVSRVT